MLKIINKFTLIMCIALIGLSNCKKDEYNFGEIQTPTGLTLDATVVGVDASNPDGDGSGKVNIVAKASGAITYKVDYGDGTIEMVPEGTITHKYSNPGTSNYTITVNAIGTGGVISTLSKQVKVFVLFNIPTAILDAFTGSTGTKVWVTDHDAVGHFGVGAADAFEPLWYAAPPNTREACAYDDEITFAKDPLNRISMTVDNKGSSFSIGASTGFYGVSGPDGCYAFSTGGTKNLAFMDATSASTPAQSTRIQFMVPGNGIINFGTGGTVYEIIAASEAQIFLRNIGADGNSWYQKLKPKP